jgi:uncharacterized protein YacL
MIMADILFWIAVAIGLMATFVAHWLAAQALLPRVVARSAEAYARRPVAVSVIGTLIGLPLGAIMLGLVDKLPHPLAKMLVIGVLAGLLIIAFIGSAGLARRVGLGLSTAADAERPAVPVLRGGVVLAVVFLAPVLGWFVLLPLTLFSGIGAWLLGRKLDV